MGWGQTLDILAETQDTHSGSGRIYDGLEKNAFSFPQTVRFGEAKRVGASGVPEKELCLKGGGRMTSREVWRGKGRRALGPIFPG